MNAARPALESVTDPSPCGANVSERDIHESVVAERQFAPAWRKVRDTLDSVAHGWRSEQHSESDSAVIAIQSQAVELIALRTRLATLEAENGALRSDGKVGARPLYEGWAVVLEGRAVPHLHLGRDAAIRSNRQFDALERAGLARCIRVHIIAAPEKA